MEPTEQSEVAKPARIPPSRIKKPLAWTMEDAAREFGLDRKTLANRFTQLGTKPDEDHKYTTRQVCAAVFGDLDQERLRLVREQADQAAIENGQARGELIAVDEAAAISARLAAGIKAKILALPLSRERLKGLLAEIQALEDVDFEKEASVESEGT